MELIWEAKLAAWRLQSSEDMRWVESRSGTMTKQKTRRTDVGGLGTRRRRKKLPPETGREKKEKARSRNKLPPKTKEDRRCRMTIPPEKETRKSRGENELKCREKFPLRRRSRERVRNEVREATKTSQANDNAERLRVKIAKTKIILFVNRIIADFTFLFLLQN